MTILSLTTLLVFYPQNTRAQVGNPPSEIQENIKAPRLLGKSTLNVFFFEIYDIFLWAERRPWNFEQQFALSIDYKRSVTTQEFVDTSIEELYRYYPQQLQAQEKRYRDILSNILLPVQKGDRITAIYAPSGRLSFFLNGRKIGEISDGEFAKMYINIWLHPNAYRSGLRRDLLGSAETTYGY